MGQASTQQLKGFSLDDTACQAAVQKWQKQLWRTWASKPWGCMRTLSRCDGVKQSPSVTEVLLEPGWSEESPELTKLAGLWSTVSPLGKDFTYINGGLHRQ